MAKGGANDPDLTRQRLQWPWHLGPDGWVGRQHRCSLWGFIGPWLTLGQYPGRG